MFIRSGQTKIALEKECFDAVEEALASKKYRWLRVAAIRANEAFENSADLLIRQRTHSSLARGNYVCALLEHCGLVKYSLMVNKKVIELP